MQNRNIGIVVSRYNEYISTKLLEGAMDTLQKAGIENKNIKIVYVPGAVEIPLAAKKLAQTKRYDAIICFGTVIKGETDHYDYVCQQASYGCQRVMLEFEIPVTFGILTTNTLEQAEDRSGGKRGHIGQEYALSTLEMLDSLEKIDKVEMLE